MTSTLQPVYGAETALTWTAAIASSATAGRQSNTIDNTTTLAEDIELAVAFTFPNSAPANDKQLYFFAGAWIGSTGGWQGRPALSGSDAAYTANDVTTTPMGLQPMTGEAMVQNQAGLWVCPSVAASFGGTLPAKMAFLLINFSGQTLSAFSATYRAISHQLV